MSYLALARKFCGELGIDADAAGQSTWRPPGAILIRSSLYGDLWLVLEEAELTDLEAQEAPRPDPRPILFAEDVARLRGQPEAAIRAALEVAREWPGARVVS